MSTEKDYVRGAVRKLLPDLLETIDLERLTLLLYSNTVIDSKQRKALKKEDCQSLFEMVIEKEIAVDGFMEVLKTQCPQQHQAILEAVEKFRTGEWNLPGKLNVESMFSINIVCIL